MALARGGTFRTLPLSGHTSTNLGLLREFGYRADSEEKDRTVVVTMGG